MGTGKEPGLGTHHSVDPAKRWAKQLDETNRHSHDPNNSDSTAEDGTRDKLIGIITEHDGYLKVRVGLDSDELHLTWTWTIGTWAGYYVYVRVFKWQVDYGLALLFDKMSRVNDGVKIPTRDKRGSNPDRR